MYHVCTVEDRRKAGISDQTPLLVDRRRSTGHVAVIMKDTYTPHHSCFPFCYSVPQTFLDFKISVISKITSEILSHPASYFHRHEIYHPFSPRRRCLLRHLNPGSKRLSRAVQSRFSTSMLGTCCGLSHPLT